MGNKGSIAAGLRATWATVEQRIDVRFGLDQLHGSRCACSVSAWGMIRINGKRVGTLEERLKREDVTVERGVASSTFERLLGNNFLQVLRLAPELLDLIGRCRTRAVSPASRRLPASRNSFDQE